MNLTSIWLEVAEGWDGGPLQAVKQLSQSGQLTSLQFDTGGKGLKEIAAMLEGNRSLTSVDIRLDGFWTDEQHENDVLAAFSLLRGIPSLQQVVLDVGCGFSCDDCTTYSAFIS